MIGFIIGVFSGIFTGLFAAWLFWKYLLFLKSDYIICESITNQVVLYNGEDRTAYCMKVINIGSRQMIDVSIKAHIRKEIDRGDKKLKSVADVLPFKMDTIDALNPNSMSDHDWVIGSFFIFAATPDYDIFNRLNDPSDKIVVTVRATDAVSNVTHVKRKEFSKGNIVKGYHSAKRDCTIIDRQKTATSINKEKGHLLNIASGVTP